MDNGKTPPQRLSPETVVLCAIAGIVGPFTFRLVVCNRIWTIGNFDRIIEALFVFYPFVFYAMISMVLVLVNPHYFGRLFVLRFGLLTGAFLAIQGSVMTAIWLFSPPMDLALVVELAFLPLIYFGLWILARNRFGWRLSLLLLIAALPVPAVLAVILDLFPDIWQMELTALGCVPFWAFASYLGLLLWTRKRVKADSIRGWIRAFIRIVWVGSYAAAIWFAVTRWFEIIAKFPPDWR